MDSVIVYPTASGTLGAMRVLGTTRVHLGYFINWTELLASEELYASLLQSSRVYTIAATLER